MSEINDVIISDFSCRSGSLGSFLQLRSSISYPDCPARWVGQFTGLNPDEKKRLERMPIKLLPSPGRAVCNEVRAHYKSNTISELAGSLPL